jgi:outer membrane protein assembly factor BamB
MKACSFSLSLIVLALACFASTAQTPTKAAWTTKFTSPIDWQRIHSLGYIIVSTGEGLYAINPDDGKIMWENKNFAALDPSLYEEIEGTEFIAVARPTARESTLRMQAIIDVMSGITVFDSDKEGIGILSRHVMPRSGKLLIIGASKSNLTATLFMYDIRSGSLLWKNDELFKVASEGKGFLAKLQAGIQSLSNLQGLIAEPVEIDDKSMLVTHPGYFMRINTATGDVMWKNSIERAFEGRVLFSPYRENVVYLGTGIESESGSGVTTTSSSSNEPPKFYYNLYYAFDLASGKPLWKAPAKEQDRLNEVIMHERGIIVCPLSSRKPTINLVDYETGEMLWGKKGKGITAQGSVVSYIPTEKGILITTGFDNAFTNKGEEYYLNVLDVNAGALRYEKSVKLKGDIVSTELTPMGLLFTTTREVNILDINSGTLLWQQSIEAGGPATGDNVRPFPVGASADKLYVYSPKESAVFEIDKKAGVHRKLNGTPIKFEGKELPRAIDVVNDGLVLYSEQNMMKLSFSGSVLYQKYYPAPREPGLVRALRMAEAVRAAYIGVAASTYAAAFGDVAAKTSDETVRALSSEVSNAYGQLGNAAFAYSANAMRAFNARFKASQNTPAFLMMMTTKEPKGNRLIQVDKASGMIENTIDIKNDREPEYDVDQIFGHLYYRPSSSEIVCYKLDGGHSGE